jgi:hypothetical protein
VPKVTLAQTRSCFLEPTRSPDMRTWHPFWSLPPPARSLRHRHRQHPPLRSGQRPASICDRRQMMKVANGGFVEIRGDCPKGRKWPAIACRCPMVRIMGVRHLLNPEPPVSLAETGHPKRHKQTSSRHVAGRPRYVQTAFAQTRERRAARFRRSGVLPLRCHTTRHMVSSGRCL